MHSVHTVVGKAMLLTWPDRLPAEAAGVNAMARVNNAADMSIAAIMTVRFGAHRAAELFPCLRMRSCSSVHLADLAFIVCTDMLGRNVRPSYAAGIKSTSLSDISTLYGAGDVQRAGHQEANCLRPADDTACTQMQSQNATREPSTAKWCVRKGTSHLENHLEIHESWPAGSQRQCAPHGLEAPEWPVHWSPLDVNDAAIVWRIIRPIAHPLPSHASLSAKCSYSSCSIAPPSVVFMRTL